jgi:hypothetical protein
MPDLRAVMNAPSEDAVRLLLQEGRTVVLLIAAGDTSMLPLLRGGDAVLAAPWSAPPRIGELLVFRQQDYLVVHRCLGGARTSDGAPCLRTRGDARSELDPPVLAERVVARVRAIRRAGIWRSLDGPAARFHGRLVAWHALFWSASGIVLGRIGLRAAAAAVDRGLVAIAVPWTFALSCRRLPPASGEGSAKTP